MLLQCIFVTTLITFALTQESTKQQINEPKDKEKSLVYLGATNPEFSQQNDIQPQPFSGQQYSPELYGLTYLQPQYQAEGALPRLQPQLVLYGPGGQGQPILINPGNPPGNFLFPQGPGPNVIIRNNPQGPQGPVFPVAGYPKPAHIPPIEKDAEEIPTNPAMIPPLQSEAKPVTNPSRKKPEKLETFNEPNQPDQNVDVNKGRFPFVSPETVSLQPGQRFFILNGDNLFNYPFESQHQVQHNIQDFRYNNVQPFPQNPPAFLQTFGQDQSQISQGGQENTVAAPIPNLQRNPFINSQEHQRSESQPSESQFDQSESQSGQPNQAEFDRDGKTNIGQQYFRTEFPTNLPQFYPYSQDYPVNQQGAIATVPLNKNIQEIQGIQRISSKDEGIQPQVVGQFRFTPNAVPGIFPFKDDYENDAIVVDASLDEPNNFGGRGGNLKAEESETTTIKQPAQKEFEPSMAQAGPQATAIAGPGGVAGSAPRATAIVGKGGLAVSSPQATAVAGTKEEDKKKPIKKNT